MKDREKDKGQKKQGESKQKGLAPPPDSLSLVWAPPPKDTLLHTLSSHKNRDVGVGVTSDGKWAVCASKDNTLKVWDIETGVDLRTLEGHTDSVRGVAVTADGKWAVSASRDDTLKVWDIETGVDLRTLEGHTSSVFGVAVTADGKRAISASFEHTLKVWDIETGVDLRTLVGHTDGVYGVAVTADGEWAVSASYDNTLKVWDIETGKCLLTLEGHTEPVRGVAVTPDGRFAVSASYDDTAKVWDIQTGRCLHTLKGHKGDVNAVAVSSDGAFAVTASDDCTLKVWDLKSILGKAVLPKEVLQYTNVKVVLVGDSGVGKTGLSLVLTEREFIPTESSHGRHVWTFQQDKVKTPGKDGKSEQVLLREILLWDLAGQPGYRIIHQLHLNETSAALIVFDARSETDPFSGVRHWNRALAQAQLIDSAGRSPMKKYLVSARSDRGGVPVSRKRIDEIIAELGFDGYIETSAKDGAQIPELKTAIQEAIDWDNVSRTASNDLFQSIKDFLVEEKKSGRTMATEDDLRQRFEHDPKTPDENRGKNIEAEFRACIGLVESRGLIRKLGFGDYVLLQPEILDAYASSLIEAAKNEPDELGSIPEQKARTADFRIPNEIRIKNPELEKMLLIAMIEDMLKHEVALRENSDLVFPSQAMRDHPEMPDPEGKKAVYRFEGPVMNVYATLVVRMAHSGLFERPQLWRNAAIFTMEFSKGEYGIALKGGWDEGWGELAVFYKGDVVEDICKQFESFVENHLERRALPGTVHRRPVVKCSKCDTVISDAIIKKRRERGAKSLNCPVCDVEISLVKKEEAGELINTRVLDMQNKADEARDREVAVSRLEGKIAAGDFDVFLCYNSNDKEEVKRIGTLLKEHGILPWFDKWNLRPGDKWQQVLSKQVETIEVAAVFIGPENPEKGRHESIGPWQREETEAFIQKHVEGHCRIIPVILPTCTKEPKLPTLLKGHHLVDFRKPDPDPLEELIYGITGEEGRAKYRKG